jgi:hypothetical protein
MEIKSRIRNGSLDRDNLVEVNRVKSVALVSVRTGTQWDVMFAYGLRSTALGLRRLESQHASVHDDSN